jgi:transcriptional regulator with XRE-family HTH domain
LTICQTTGNLLGMQPTAHTLVGATIRAEMGRQRISMLELARRTGIPRSTLAYQIGKDVLTVTNLITIAHALGVTAATLIGEKAA